MIFSRCIALAKNTTIVGCSFALLATSGCSYVSTLTHKISGNEERLVPDEGMVPLAGRRLPVLNPGGKLYKSDADLESQRLEAENPYLSQGRAEGGVKESASMTGWSGNVFNGSQNAGVQDASQLPASAQMDVNARRLPLENQTLMQQPPTFAAVPVAPIAPPAPGTTSSAPQPIAMMPQAEIGRDGFPELSATPPAPVALPEYAHQAKLDSLIAERELAENMRREALSNPAIVAEPLAPQAMPWSAPPAQTVQIEPSALQTTTPQPRSDAEFTGWLKNMFNEKEAPVALANSSAESLTQKPIAYNNAPQPLMNPLPDVSGLSQQARAAEPLEPIILTPPKEHVQEPMQLASAPPLEPITLTPPPEVASVPDPEGFAANPEPIVLQPPVHAVNNNVRFLPDGRYASRRGAARMAMAR